MKIAVLGGGNAGFAFSAHLSQIGHQVYMYEDAKYAENISEIQKGPLKAKCHFEGSYTLSNAGSDMSITVKDAKVVIVAVPAFAQEPMFNEYIKYAEEGQVVIFFPGNYASLRFNKVLKDKGMEGRILLAESDSIPYSARKSAADEIDIEGMKDFLFVSALPAGRTQEVIDLWNNEVFKYDFFRSGLNVMYSSLNNTNCSIHCTGSILNAGWIETTKGDFKFYKDGLSPSVCNVIEGVDYEAGNVSELFGKRTYTQKEFFMEYYDIPDYPTLFETMQNSPAHTSFKAPDSLMARYITEDVPFGLVPIATISKQLGLKTPVCDALITLAQVLTGIDFMAQGMTPEKLGISGMTIEEILEMIN